MAAYRRVYDSSHLQADCQEPGSVRERLKGFGHILYAARLYRLKAETLELRRLKHDLTTMFSIIRGFVIAFFAMSLIVSPFTLVVIILDFIRSSAMLTAVRTLLSAATLISGTGYPLTS